MRNLTLGVLIVSGGTLAALPFRRVPTDRGSLDASVRATGPTVTPLDTSTVEVNFSRSAGTPASMAGSQPWRPRAVTEPMHGERFIAMPETFDREKVPLSKPQLFAERFSASVEFQSETSAARQATDHASVISADLATMQSRFRGPLVGGAVSSPVPAAAHRFNELAVGPAGEALATTPKFSIGQTRDNIVSNASTRAAYPLLPAAEQAQVAPESTPPLPPAQAERSKLWIHQPN